MYFSLIRLIPNFYDMYIMYYKKFIFVIISIYNLNLRNEIVVTIGFGTC